MPVSVEQFVDGLSTSGLIPPDELDRLRSDLASRQPQSDVQSLAQELVRAGKITKFQAQVIYQGKGKGLVCGEYVLLEKIGAGGMGQVFKARHRRMNRVVAIKLLAPHVAAANKDKAIKRFSQEVEVAARLVHPNIVTAFDAGESHGLHYLVMEFVDGQDVASCVKSDKQLPLGQTLAIVLQAARGLEYAHAQGIVHRDIKPSNLLIDKQGRVKILDMGLARCEQALAEIDRAAGDNLTQSGEVMGTVDYMAPEQARDTHEADARSDIYSLGCTFYRLATGVVPYDGKTLVDKLMAHQQKPIPALSPRCDGVSERLQLALVRMLAKDPTERFQSMGEVIAELEACQAATPEEDHSPLVTDVPVVDSSSASFLSRASGTGLSRKNLPLPQAVPLASSEPRPRRAARGKPVQARFGWRHDRRVWFVGGSAAAIVLLGALLTFSVRNRGTTQTEIVISPTAPPVASETETAKPDQQKLAPPGGDAFPNFDLPPGRTPADGIPPQPKPKKRPKPLPTPPAIESAASPSTDSPVQSVTSLPLESARPSTPPPQAEDGRINVLKAIDVASHSVEGDWRKLPTGNLLSPRGSRTARIQVPVAPPSEYILEIVAARKMNGPGGLLLGLVVGGRQCLLSVGSLDKFELGLLDGKPMFNRAVQLAEGAAPGARLKPAGEFSLIRCQVSPRRVALQVDGQTALDWQGDNRRLSLDPAYQMPGSQTLFVAGFLGMIEISRFEMIPVVAAPVASRRGVPSPSEQQKALEAIKETFRQDYAKAARPEDKATLARKLFEQAKVVADHPASRYMLLLESRNLAAESLDFDLLGQIPELLAHDFEVYPLDIAAEGWEITLRKQHPAALQKRVAEILLDQLDKAVGEEHFSTAQRLNTLASGAVRKALDGALAKRATERSKRLADQVQQWDDVQRSRRITLEFPDDPGANLTLGRYRCFLQGNWPEGFTHLAKCNEPVFKNLAERSLANPNSAAERMALGDAWWDEAAKASNPTQTELRLGAAYWYSLALPGLSGIDKVKIEQRINETATNPGAKSVAVTRPVRPTGKPVDSQPIDLLKLIDPRRDTFQGKGHVAWTFHGPNLSMPVDSGPTARLQVPYVPPAEYILTLSASRVGTSKGPIVVGLVVGGRQCCFYAGAMQAKCGLELVGSKPFDSNETTVKGAEGIQLRADRESTIICSVRKNGLVITIDDKKVVDWKGDSRRLSLDPGWRVSNPAALFIGAKSGAFEFHKIELAPPTD